MRYSYTKNTNDIETKTDFINELIENQHLKNFLRIGICPIAELIENIYSHAMPDPSISVDWSIELHIDNESLHVVIEDEGQGIPNSIRSKLNDNSISTSESIERAVEGRFENGRGMGLLSIKNQVACGEIALFTIECDDKRLHFNVAGKCSEESIKEINGTRITLSIEARGN